MPPHNTDDVRIRELKELTPPAHLIREFACAETVSERDLQLAPARCIASCTAWTTG